jgi:hypothetical protein
MAVNSRAVARLKLFRFDKFEARNRPHLHIPIRQTVQKLSDLFITCALYFR